MKKKKSPVKEFLMTCVSIILALIVFFAILLYIGVFGKTHSVFVFFTQKPQFIIEKDECRNEINKYNLNKYNELNNELRVLIKEKQKQIDLNLEENQKKSEGELVKITKEIIELNKKLFQIELFYEFCERVEVDNLEVCHIEYFRCNIVTDVECGNKDEKVCETIKKSDLSLEWLEENCECLKPIGYKCQEFKCGEYFVKIK